MRHTLLFCLSLFALPVAAQSVDLEAIVEDHVLAGYADLSASTRALETASQATCDPGDAGLQAAYHDAFDAWVRVSHLRFGPSETDTRAFALAFWPDPRGSTPKTLATLIRDADPVVEDAADFATVSVAARGFYALEYLLFDAQFTAGDAPDYRCALVRAIARDVAGNSSAIEADWTGGYAALLAMPGNDTYRTEAEAAQQLFTALTTGLEFTENMRLGRPLGTFERPRPNRAEARRSERSLRNVVLSLEATQALAAQLSGGSAAVAADYERALERAAALDDPTLAGVADPAQRFRVEALQSAVTTIRRTLLEDVGPSLGVTAGFNSLDGD
ncbi:MAG: imelysin family protein [Pseudomonadota bacterium]